MIQQMYPQVNHTRRYELNKDMHFAAAHRVPHPGAGVCQDLHGHTYFVNITVVGDDLDEMGFLINFKALKDLVHKRFDHKILNKDESFTDSEDESSIYFPTTEIVAQTIWEIVEAHLATQPNRPRCAQVFVRETPTSYVVYRPTNYYLEGHDD